MIPGSVPGLWRLDILLTVSPTDIQVLIFKALLSTPTRQYSLLLVVLQFLEFKSPFYSIQYNHYRGC